MWCSPLSVGLLCNSTSIDSTLPRWRKPLCSIIRVTKSYPWLQFDIRITTSHPWSALIHEMWKTQVVYLFSQDYNRDAINKVCFWVRMKEDLMVSRWSLHTGMGWYPCLYLPLRLFADLNFWISPAASKNKNYSIRKLSLNCFEWYNHFTERQRKSQPNRHIMRPWN